MARFAEAADLAEFLQTATQVDADAGNPDVLDTAIANRALDAATASIQAVCGWNILQETVTKVVPYQRCILLPTLFLTALSITDEQGHVVDPNLYEWWDHGKVDLLWAAYHPLAINSTTIWRFRPRVTLTYTHGWVTAPAVIKSICLEQAGAQYVNPTALASSSRLGAVDVYRRSDQGPGSLLDSDPRLIPYKLTP